MDTRRDLIIAWAWLSATACLMAFLVLAWWS